MDEFFELKPEDIDSTGIHVCDQRWMVGWDLGTSIIIFRCKTCGREEMMTVDHGRF